MLYMVIETFHPGKVHQLYERFDRKGRLMPEGVRFINSWIDEGIAKCFQVMETDTPELLQDWISNWNYLADFEITPVLTSAQAREKVLGH